MARIFGTIESLKSLKSELDSHGISRFNSVKEINEFLTNFNDEKLAILNDETKKLEIEYQETCTNLIKSKKLRKETINLESEKIETKICDLQSKINLIETKNTNFLKRLISSIKLRSLKRQLNYYFKNKTTIVNTSVQNLNYKIEKDEIFIKEYKTGKQKIVDDRAKPKIRKLEYIKRVLENSKNLISGAIGENLVVKEVKKLSDDYVLINDFNLNFSSPIFYKKYNQRINSIQIDHLLISKSGIFIIETKNWSKSSVNSISLRSPIQQIERSSFGLYIYISENITLNDHHWGEQTVPIRNLIVMINNKPKGQFKYVSIKLLRELNDYIKYFEPVLTDKQFNRIVTELV